MVSVEDGAVYFAAPSADSLVVEAVAFFAVVAVVIYQCLPFWLECCFSWPWPDWSG